MVDNYVRLMNKEVTLFICLHNTRFAVGWIRLVKQYFDINFDNVPSVVGDNRCNGSFFS